MSVRFGGQVDSYRYPGAWNGGGDFDLAKVIKCDVLKRYRAIKDFSCIKILIPLLVLFDAVGVCFLGGRLSWYLLGQSVCDHTLCHCTIYS